MTLEGAWLNKKTPASADDFSSNGNDGTTYGNPTFEKVGMDFDGINDKIDCGDLGNIQMVSMWVMPDTTTEELFLVDTNNDVMVSGGTVTYTGLTEVNTYVNGVDTNTMVADVWQHLVCIFSQVDANNFEIGTDGSNYGDIKVKDIRAYDEVKSADWIKQEYQKGVPDDDLLIHVVDGTKDLSKYRRSLTLTSMEVVGKRMKFDGASSKIDTGSDFIGTGADSVSAWIYKEGLGEGDVYARIIDNGKTILKTVASNLVFYSDGATATNSAANSIRLNTWYHIVVTRDSTGANTNFYVNGVLSGSVNQDSGTPVAGTTNVIIGNNSGQSHTFDGLISDVRVYSRVLTPDEIKVIYNQTKKYY